MNTSTEILYYVVEVGIDNPREKDTLWKPYDYFITKAIAIRCIKKLGAKSRVVECRLIASIMK